ncbi:hypothetical protein DFJ74DRAFT_399798 [Hyaloraphidium curvatum]|nr:hypothetical protein DFJ74DRAFT_399798 [Hyaloraphidium curvatum]
MQGPFESAARRRRKREPPPPHRPDTPLLPIRSTLRPPSNGRLIVGAGAVSVPKTTRTLFPAAGGRKGLTHTESHTDNSARRTSSTADAGKLAGEHRTEIERARAGRGRRAQLKRPLQRGAPPDGIGGPYRRLRRRKQTRGRWHRCSTALRGPLRAPPKRPQAPPSPPPGGGGTLWRRSPRTSGARSPRAGPHLAGPKRRCPLSGAAHRRLSGRRSRPRRTGCAGGRGRGGRRRGGT